MIKHYKFKMIEMFQDDGAKESPYYPSGVVSLINYEEFIKQQKISVMWKSPSGVAHESYMSLKKLKIEECSADEYNKISTSIDYAENNSIQKIIKDHIADKYADQIRPSLTIIKPDS